MRGTRIRRDVRDLCIFAMLAALTFGSKLAMEILPNVHIIGALIMVYTVVYRTRALIPLYLFVLITGLYAGFASWWLPYLYIWTVLWGLTMLIPRGLPRSILAVIYPAICALHGFAFGTLYAPMQALIFGLDFKAMIAWIIAGLPFDAIHGVSNLVAGLLVLPLSMLLKKLDK